MSIDVWRDIAWVCQAQFLLDSYAHWLRAELLPRSGDKVEDARRLFHADIVVVSHGTQPDPILNYGNLAALVLWEMDVVTFTSTPSRQTAEPVYRDERARLLQRTTRDGYVDDYQGVRISQSGQRFNIDHALVWNVLDFSGDVPMDCGQAAMFSKWHMLDK
jgi:hypothetical protein